MTAQNLIYQALRKCGQMRPGYLPSPELLADALSEWQMMFDAWNAERTLNYTMPDYVYAVTGPGHGTTGNDQSFGGTGYQIGPTAQDFVGPRPVAIARANLLMTNVPNTPARIPLSQISMEEWMAIAVVQFTATNITTTFAYDPQYPNGVIWVWPPLNGNSLEIFEWGQLAPPQALSDTYAAPPGYWDAVVWCLAERLWPLCTHDLMVNKIGLGYLAGKAAQSQAKIKAVNAPMPRMGSDFRGNRSNVGTADLDLLLTGRPY